MTLSIQNESYEEPVSDFDSRYQNALRFFTERSPVVFVSQHYRYWDEHGFVQQSLAKHLVEAGIKVYWFDGAHWKKNKPVKNWNSLLLEVAQLPSLPLRRLPVLDGLTAKFQASVLKKVLSRGRQPFVWVQSGLDERVVSQLPYVDVFSVFDDPYLHAPDGILCTKARLVIVQNQFAENCLSPCKQKMITLYPPVDMSPESLSDELVIEFPTGFPSKKMGYIGSFFSEGFDLVLFESFIRSFPDYGFVLCGRTDALGLKKVRSFEKYKNFSYIPWIPRKQIGALWKKLDLNLMLYRPASVSDGAFPVKFLEALYYDIPSITTHVPKTSSLEGVIPRLVFPEQLKIEAEKIVNQATQPVKELYKNFSQQMDPKFHLIQVAEASLKNLSSRKQ